MSPSVLLSRATSPGESGTAPRRRQTCDEYWPDQSNGSDPNSWACSDQCGAISVPYSTWISDGNSSSSLEDNSSLTCRHYSSGHSGGYDPHQSDGDTDVEFSIFVGDIDNRLTTLSGFKMLNCVRKTSAHVVSLVGLTFRIRS